jgi:ferrochelatase
MKKIAIILLNLGGPSSLKEVRTFLFNLFYDKAIIRLPNPFRWLVAQIISRLRESTAKDIYRQMGGSSPILEETISQKKALEIKLNSRDIRVFIAMRYSKPFSSDAVEKIKEFSPDQIILLPLYPQFSTTTTESSIEDAKREIRKAGLDIPVKAVGCYPMKAGFIKAHIGNIKEALKKVKSKNYRILFSAHSLPEKIIKDGDPYQWQIDQTVKEVVKGLKIKDLDYKVTYQSKVTPVKWLEPFTEEEIKIACKEKDAIIIVPIAFVSEHSETLVELDIEYREIADKKGIEYHRIPSLGTNKLYIQALADIVKDFSKTQKSLVTSDKMSRICPKEFDKCICKGA